MAEKAGHGLLTIHAVIMFHAYAYMQNIFIHDRQVKDEKPEAPCMLCPVYFYIIIFMRSFLQVTEPSSAKALLNLLKCMCVFLMIFMHACVHQASPNQWRAILRSFQVRDLKIHACII